MDCVGSSLAPVLGYWQPSSATLVSLFVVLVVLTLKWYNKHRKFFQIVDKIPGPRALPIVGNILAFNSSAEVIFKSIVEHYATWGENTPIFRLWACYYPIVFLVSPEAVEAVLSNTKHITKSREYGFLFPWLATGLLTSTGDKWFTRRKLLTPAFHFQILEDFIEVFNEQSLVLVDKLHSAMLQNGGEGIDIFEYTTRCTLDIICDSVMGRHIEAQGHEDSEYVQAVNRIASIVNKRQSHPWFQPEVLFNLTPYAAEQKHCLEILHGFTDQVIKERKLEFQQRKITEENNQSLPENDREFMTKKRIAFLDLLLTASEDGQVLSDSDIREEVDTFMFEGHDTTATGICWCLFLLGCDPDIQDRVFEEIQEVLGSEPDRPLTMQDLPNLKYLECCIKEAQRLYPSVPLIAREIKEDLKIRGYTIPAGCSAFVFLYTLHRIASIFPDPEAFIPERFTSDNCRGRHPYAYVPFSAGPRNCIGQRFALMEAKIVIAQVLRQFQVKSLTKREDIKLVSELILRPKDKLRLSLIPRITANKLQL